MPCFMSSTDSNSSTLFQIEIIVEIIISKHGNMLKIVLFAYIVHGILPAQCIRLASQYLECCRLSVNLFLSTRTPTLHQIQKMTMNRVRQVVRFYNEERFDLGSKLIDSINVLQFRSILFYIQALKYMCLKHEIAKSNC